MREVLETPMLIMSHTNPMTSPGENSERKQLPQLDLPVTGEQMHMLLESAACTAKDEISASQDPGDLSGPAAANQHSEAASISTAFEEAHEAPGPRAAADMAADAEMDAAELETAKRLCAPMTSMAVCAAQLGEEEAFPSLVIDADGRGPTLLLRRQGMHKAAAAEDDYAQATPAAEGRAAAAADAPPPGAGAAEVAAESAAWPANDDPELSGEPQL